MVAVATCVPSPNGGAPNKSRLTVCEGCEGVYVGGCVGVEDQLLRLSQCVYDWFERQLKSGLMLFDLSRAYDRVWRDGLLWKLCDSVLSVGIIRWWQMWLCNRINWVKVNCVRSKSRMFAQRWRKRKNICCIMQNTKSGKTKAGRGRWLQGPRLSCFIQNS